jgi:hypothetical protein
VIPTKEIAMPEPVNALMLQFLAWICARPRTYVETMEAWRSTCPRHTIWEDAITDGLVTIESDGLQQSVVTLAPRGRAILNASSESVNAPEPPAANQRTLGR